MYDSIYLLQTRESIFKNEDVFKIGRTSQDELKRFNCYPKGSKLHLHISCFNGINVEKLIIDLFGNKYSNVDIYGAEYFRGDLCNMIKDILHIIGHNFDSIHSHSTLSCVFREKDHTIAQLKQQIDAMQQQIDAMQQQNHAMQQQNRDLHEKNDDLQDRVDLLQKNVHDLLDQISLHEDQVDEIDGIGDEGDGIGDEVDGKGGGIGDEVDGKGGGIGDGKVDGIGDQGFRCSKCNKNFSRKDSLRRHEKKCKGLIDPHQCQICLKVFTSAWGRIKHNKNVQCSSPLSAIPPPPASIVSPLL